ncbi:hypothetical protein EV401DRAFT_1932490 [Pisolithus croceorrhizus]|nr:hypothetical protein EV401DRAFT_1932490 [Pisolithus croceorrhizus]
MGTVSLEALLPLISIVLTFLDLVLIVARRREFLRVPGVCVKSLRAGFDGAGSRLAVRRFLSRFASFCIDPGGTPFCQ